MKPGKLQAGRTQIPFEFFINPNPNKKLYETYHGVHIFIQYLLRCDIKKNLLAKGHFKTQEIYINCSVSK